ncbi:MAG TPA: glycerol-3-phosphate dehydrogenase, partial [Bacteroidetes bacterium]|nr:glycerol-3-phosphate dehydrogenase [Bacteroidota bacterium]
MSVRVSVLGAGSWGTALAILMASKYADVILWEFRPDVAGELAETRENKLMLPDVFIPEKIRIISDFEEAVVHRDVLVLAVPSHIMREVSLRLNQADFGEAILVSVAKGIENQTLMRMSEVIHDAIP